MAPQLATAAPLARNYEELDGAQGREVFFRPHRYRAQDLSPLKCTVVVHADDLPVVCALYDVSQNGVAFEWPAEMPVAVDDTLADIEVRFDDHLAFRGAGRVGSVREQDDVFIVGISLSDLLIDVDEVLQLRIVKGWSGRDGQGLRVDEKTWRVAGYDKFKSHVAELSLFFEDSERKFDELEKELAWHVVQGQERSAARTALVHRVRDQFASEVVRASDEIDAILRTVPPAHAATLRQYSLRMVDDFLMQVPWMHRARFKPFGYPGDYEVMRFFYERDFEGPSLFAKALGHAFMQTKGALAVKYRKDLVKRQLRERIETHGESTEPLRFLSVAAGPAQELYELLAELPRLRAPLEVVLFDQDKGALSHAFRRLKPLIAERFAGQVRLTYLNESIKRLLRDSDLFSSFGHFDAIYSVGLFDYLQTTTAVILARNLYARLRSGGSLYLANMAPENPCRWFIETHLDWHLIHRTRPELVEIGHRAASDATIRVLEEESGVNPFIQMTKP
jgi:SAM-dependent methyltransferase